MVDRGLRDCSFLKAARDPPVNTYEDYRKSAADCFAMAMVVMDARRKADLLDLAYGWLRLADQAEKRAAPTPKD